MKKIIFLFTVLAFFSHSCGRISTTIVVKSVSLNKYSYSLTVGEVFLLTATVLPEDATDKSVTWKSSAESVLKVNSNGQVEAIGPGEGTVIVTTNDGGFTASCRITAKTINVESITLNSEHLELMVGQSVTLTATVLPENATDKSLKWQSSNEKVVTVDSEGKLKAESKGEAIITAKSGDVEATCTVIVSDEVSGGHEGTTVEIW